MKIEIVDLGLMPYREAYAIQHTLFDEMVSCRRAKQPLPSDTIFAVEHYPVITLGLHANRENVLIPDEILKGRGIEVIRIERGGDVTYHGPGQLVLYPVIDLEKRNLGVKDYVAILEEAVIRTVADYGIRADRVEGAPGVWIKDDMGERKICALGIKCSRHITMHGLALNVNTNLEDFNLINPCGFIDKGVTSIQKEAGHGVPVNEVRDKLIRHLSQLLLGN